MVTALEAATGKTVWEYEYDNPFANAYSESVGPGPYAMPQVLGDRVVMASGTGKIHSLDKKTGKSVWSHDLYNGLAISTPVWAPGNLLFVAPAYGTGARALELHQASGNTTVQELWYDRRLQLHFGTAIQHDGYVYFSSGYDGPVFMTAVELKTGQVKWRERGFAKAQLLSADGKIMLADQDGTLGPLQGKPAGVRSTLEGLCARKASPGRRRRSWERTCTSATAGTSKRSISADSPAPWTICSHVWEVGLSFCCTLRTFPPWSAFNV